MQGTALRVLYGDVDRVGGGCAPLEAGRYEEQQRLLQPAAGRPLRTSAENCRQLLAPTVSTQLWTATWQGLKIQVGNEGAFLYLASVFIPLPPQHFFRGCIPPLWWSLLSLRWVCRRPCPTLASRDKLVICEGAVLMLL